MNNILIKVLGYLHYNYYCLLYTAFDFNSTTTSLRIFGGAFQLFSASELVFTDDILEGEEGFILYLEVDTECTNLGDTAVVRLSNNATLVNITELGEFL